MAHDAHGENEASGASAANGERPLSRDETDTVKTASAPATAAAGALAGATAGLVTGPFGPVAAGIGAIVGALGGAAVGAAGGRAATEPRYTEEDDAYYRGLWEGAPNRVADRTYDASRPAYQLGHLAAQHPDYAGRDFDAVEPDLRRVWERDLRARHGEWDAVRHDVHDAYGHARSLGYGVRRDASVVGTAGSAVDPVELERARAGLPSVDEPTRPTSDAQADAASVDARGEREISIVEAQRDGRELR